MIMGEANLGMRREGRFAIYEGEVEKILNDHVRWSREKMGNVRR